MRLLIVTNRYRRSELDSPWLIDDLVEELREQGAVVDVIVSDRAKPRPRGIQSCSSQEGGGFVHSVGPVRPIAGVTRRALNLVGGALRVRLASRSFMKAYHYDSVIYPTIAAQYGGVARSAQRRKAPSVFVVWDFFPIHHQQIGSFPGGGSAAIAKLVERWAIGRPSVSLVMSPGNARFLREYHPRLGGVTRVVPPWAGGTASARRSKTSRLGLVAVFGGQLVKGRGVDTIVEACRLLQDRQARVRVRIVGDGPARASFEQLAQGYALRNIEFCGHLSRAEYWSLLETCTVGIAATVPDVTVPSFPSKIADYCRAGLPVVVSCERSSDVGDLLEDAGVGIKVTAGDSLELANALAALSSDISEARLVDMSLAASRYFDETLSVSAAARAIIAAVGEIQERKE